MLRRRYGTFEAASSLMLRPATQIVPRSGCSCLLRRRSRVDLPEPDGPTRNTNSLFGMSKVGVADGDHVVTVDLGDVVELDHEWGVIMAFREVPP